MPYLVVAALVVGLLLWPSYVKLEGTTKQRIRALLRGALFTTAAAILVFKTRFHWLGLLSGGLLLLAQHGGYAAIRRLLTSPRDGSSRGNNAGSPRAPAMTRKEALEVLGCADTASNDEIKQRYRELMRNVHPDRGGSAFLARQLNQAKEVLLG